MLGRITGRELPQERVHASVAAALIAVQNGAAIVRVHDVAATRDALAVWQAVASGIAVREARLVDPDAARRARLLAED
jgi:dihydropteroate synthase